MARSKRICHLIASALSVSSLASATIVSRTPFRLPRASSEVCSWWDIPHRPELNLNFYKQLIAIRRDQPALRNGSYEALNRRDADVLSYLRKNPQSGESVLVVLNMSNQPKTVSFDLKPEGITGNAVKPLLSNPSTHAAMPLNAVLVASFGTFIGAVK